jgi:hypothetical protein
MGWVDTCQPYSLRNCFVRLHRCNTQPHMVYKWNSRSVSPMVEIYHLGNRHKKIYQWNHRKIYPLHNLCNRKPRSILLGHHTFRSNNLCRRLGLTVSLNLKIYQAHNSCKQLGQYCHRCIGPFHNLCKLIFRFDLGTCLYHTTRTRFHRLRVVHNLPDTRDNWWHDQHHCWLCLAGNSNIRFGWLKIDTGPPRTSHNFVAPRRFGIALRHKNCNHFLGYP